MEALTSDIRRQTLDWLWVSIEALSASREPWIVIALLLRSIEIIAVALSCFPFVFHRNGRTVNGQRET